MREEILKIIHMVLEGKVKPEEGASLIEALFSSKGDRKNDSSKKMLVVDVSGDEIVKVRIPLKLLSVAKDLIPMAMTISGEKLSEDVMKSVVSAMGKLEQSFEDMEGDIMQIEEENEKIRIYLE